MSMQEAAEQPTYCPKLFILTTFFEGVEELRACIRSLVHQTIPFTAVVVDDGSNLLAYQRARHLIEHDERFLLIKRPMRQGPAAARQTGLNHIQRLSRSSRDVVVLLDGDDRLLRNSALELIRSIYIDKPSTRMTLGRSITHRGRRLYRKSYRDWHFPMKLQRHLLDWRGDHPRSFRVGLLKMCEEDFHFQWPDGEWLQGATDMALLLPMLQKCRADEVVQVCTTLYEYRFGRADGLTIGDNPEGRLEQFAGEYFVRRSALFTAWKALRYPRRTWRVVRKVLSKLCSNTPSERISPSFSTDARRTGSDAL